MKRTKKCNCKDYKYQVCDICQEITGKEKDKSPLTIKHFHEVNVARSHADIKHSRDWIPLSFGGALAGEVGELCNDILSILIIWMSVRIKKAPNKRGRVRRKQ